MRQKRLWQLLSFFLLAAGGCAAVSTPEMANRSEAFPKAFTEHAPLEKLHQNEEKLMQIFKDIRLISEGNLFYGSDEQLNTIQKASLYILSSARTVRYQSVLLSISPNIRSNNSNEYTALLLKESEQAVFDSANDLNFLNTYHAFIDNKAAREHIDGAVALIRENIELYKQLMAIFSARSDLK